MMPAIYGNAYQIVQGPGYAAIRYELIHEARVIPLDGRPHVGKNVRLDLGDARGHWDGIRSSSRRPISSSGARTETRAPRAYV